MSVSLTLTVLTQVGSILRMGRGQVLRNVIGDGRKVIRVRGHVPHLANINEQ